MNTRYILVGGYPHKAPDGGKAFVEELVRGFALTTTVRSVISFVTMTNGILPRLKMFTDHGPSLFVVTKEEPYCEAGNLLESL